MDFCSKKVIITCCKDKAHPRDTCRKRQQLTFLAPAILCYYRTQIFSLASRFWVIRRKCIQPSTMHKPSEDLSGITVCGDKSRLERKYLGSFMAELKVRSY